MQGHSLLFIFVSPVFVKFSFAESMNEWINE